VWSGATLTVHTNNGYIERGQNMKAERNKKERKKERKWYFLHTIIRIAC
jgi:hypothetical protein